MIKKKKVSNDNVVKFPSKLTDIEKEIEAVIFAAAEPLDVDTIESKISKKLNVAKTLKKLQQEVLGLMDLLYIQKIILKELKFLKHYLKLLILYLKNII